MNDNLLLMYLSELGHGRWPQFRQALDYLAEDEDVLFRLVKARQLSALGHLEFAFEGDLRWAVSEPTIAWLSRTDQLIGVLCGQRSHKLIDDLAEWCDQLDCRMDSISQEEGPDVIYVIAPSSNIGEQLAQHLNLRTQMDAAERLAEIIPNVASYLRLCPAEPSPRGFKTEKFNTQELRWDEVGEDVDPGFYRYTHYRREYRLKIDEGTIKTPPYIGIFAWLQHEKRTVFKYESEQRVLMGPVSAILPPLFARAATLCSGFLPRFESYHHIYVDVPDTVARQLLHKMHQGRWT